MIEWQCPECGTANDASAPRCLVCDGAAPATAESAPAVLTFVPGGRRRRAAAPAGRWRVAAIALVVLAGLLGAGYLLVDTGAEPAAGTTSSPEAVSTEPFGEPEISHQPESFSVAEPSAVAEPVPFDEGLPEPAPGRIGLVSIAPAAAGDARVVEIATLFDTYFTGINTHDPTVATRVFAPGGVVDPGDAGHVATFNADTATTQDFDVWLLAVDGDVATVSFTSSQAPGFGPPERPGETCTNWRLDFRLTGDPLILGTAPGAASSPCA
ncbi:zinc finger protein [Catenuloplanes indicus]|uniref:RanBP2-type domain-containing protein n=1 Tax=Catenuloplanes indicus TaxID=137267 RepID=A0AAE3VZG4_9ACTN|nr:zinc finger protein [Catenuloplanes indicus]MDQ0365815.1 hypothetical protein [Catenuloplanes indicus]